MNTASIVHCMQLHAQQIAGYKFSMQELIKYQLRFGLRVLALLSRMNGFFLTFAVSVFLIGCLGVKGDGAMLLEESIEHLVNYTAYKALDQLNLENIGNNVANDAYESYKDVLGMLVKCRICMHSFQFVFMLWL